MRGILWLTLPEQVSPVEPRFVPARHFHVTLQFGVERQDVEHLIGQTVRVRCIELCHNGSIEAIRVVLPEGVECGNAHPHMTLSHVEGVRPVESNAMLAAEHEAVPLGLELELVAEFSPFAPQ